MEQRDMIIGLDDPILITGATGFIGVRLVKNLLDRGFRRLRCFSRPSSSMAKLEALVGRYQRSAEIEIVKGNLLRREDCLAATKDVAVIYHLAAGAGEKSVPDAFMNSVVTTRNLLDASLQHGSLRRFVNVSSFTVYTNERKPKGTLLDESCPVEPHPERVPDAYCYAKVKQDELVTEYGKKHGIPYVIVRPGSVYGPGKKQITGRVGIDTFGVFLHLGGGNRIPFTYVDNCADAIALAGLKPGVEGEVFNIVDDNLPSSRTFLRLYKQNVRRFASLYVPHAVSYLFCRLWEKYSAWSYGQLPPVFNRRRWHAEMKRTSYSNHKLKARLGWTPKVSMEEGLER
ncbi:MAG TPA: NAD(P)-dependent oxidoreductase, partial [Nitrospira sp.]|nr:NAD(P)-dependent oxidoreductase [Nitrospira sp.]